MRYGVEKFKNCFPIFSDTVKDKSHDIFRNDVSLDVGVCNRNEHFVRHVWSLQGVKKEIKHFKLLLFI